jgi:hypothetical protein
MITTNDDHDEARIFQALCTELTRLSGLRPPPLADIEHARKLRDRYARAVSYARRESHEDRRGLETPRCPDCEHAHWPGDTCTRVTPATGSGFSPRCGCTS